MVAMAALQVFIVKMFFTGGRKGEFKALRIGGIANLTLTDGRIRVNECMAWFRRIR